MLRKTSMYSDRYRFITLYGVACSFPFFHEVIEELKQGQNLSSSHQQHARTRFGKAAACGDVGMIADEATEPGIAVF